MRLLNTKTLGFHEFIGSSVPPYAVLSHTWGDEEISFHDMLNGGVSIHGKAGYEKIKSCCENALSDGFEYAWVDTCCIDKSSSAELSEAINSMYRFYQKARVCYVILSDVPSDGDHFDPTSTFRNSRWFTRGWTLQELIAPTSVIFYAQDWKEIGTKSGLKDLIVQITQIHPDILSGEKVLTDFSIAQKMSWASQRNTTRVEDVAYCLMGIFDVNMPLLYGEGTKAFLRLQEQILHSTEDDSILAWTLPDQDRDSCLADSPKAFVGARNIVWGRQHGVMRPLVSHSLTNKGLHIQLESFVVDGDVSEIWVVLNCKDEVTGHRVALVFGRSEVSHIRLVSHQFLSLSEDEIEEMELKPRFIYMYVDRSSQEAPLETLSACLVETVGLRENYIHFLTMIHSQKFCLGENGVFYWLKSDLPSSGYPYFTIFRFCRYGRDLLAFDIVLRFRNYRTDHLSTVTATIEVPPIQYVKKKIWLVRPEYEERWKGTDQVIWHDSERRVWIKVCIRPHNIIDPPSTSTVNGRDLWQSYAISQAFKLQVSWDEPGNTTTYESKTVRASEDWGIKSGLVDSSANGTGVESLWRSSLLA